MHIDGVWLVAALATWGALFNWMRIRRYKRAYNDLADLHQEALDELVRLQTEEFHREQRRKALIEHPSQQG